MQFAMALVESKDHTPTYSRSIVAMDTNSHSLTDVRESKLSVTVSVATVLRSRSISGLTEAGVQRS